MNRLKNKVVIVTGGALGIGKSACEIMAREGAKIAITDILDNEGEALAKEIIAAGGEAKYWHMDVAKFEDSEKVFAQINDEFGKIDVLVNNAGISGVNKPTHEVTPEEWQKTLDINLNGVFYCTKNAIPYMKKNGSGNIINLSSIYGIISAPDLPAYHASKGAVRLMSKTDAIFYAQDNIRVNSVHPGFIWTPLVENLAKEQPGGVEEFKKALDSLHPIGHVGKPEDIGNAILFLASDESKFITGSELVVDGGYTCK